MPKSILKILIGSSSTGSTITRWQEKYGFRWPVSRYSLQCISRKRRKLWKTILCNVHRKSTVSAVIFLSINLHNNGSHALYRFWETAVRWSWKIVCFRTHVSLSLPCRPICMCVYIGSPKNRGYTAFDCPHYRAVTKTFPQILPLWAHRREHIFTITH